MGFCIALAVRDMGMTIEEAVAAATHGGRRGPAARRRRPACAPAPGPTRSILEATSYADLVYRPGVPLVSSILARGRLT